MQNIFKYASSYWVKYSRYELKTGPDGTRYVTPAPGAAPKVYNPLKDPQRLVVDALNVGMLRMGNKSKDLIQKAVMDFIHQYGLLGLMTALPTTPFFLDYEAVYFLKNRFIKTEMMKAEDYLALFYPFEALDIVREGTSTAWNLCRDNTMRALMLTFQEQPMAMNMLLQRQYAEPYDWLVQQFTDWAFTLTGSFLYYHDYDSLNETQKNTYQMGMSAFGGIAPSYHISLLDKPTIIWDFHSLLEAIHIMFNFQLVDDDRPLKLCTHCQKVFIANRPNQLFCSPQCKSKHGVYRQQKGNNSNPKKSDRY